MDEPYSRSARPAVEALADATLSIEITTPERLATIEREWRDLSGRALADNAFLEPALIAAAAVLVALVLAGLVYFFVDRAQAPDPASATILRSDSHVLDDGGADSGTAREPAQPLCGGNRAKKKRPRFRGLDLG